ncbi:MAG: hypothetical protein KF858_04260 [Candidatus Sumerlaeia bacterium]|nr:hypothetical protein [Candidatus Sumerlaeia bacterium]
MVSRRIRPSELLRLELRARDNPIIMYGGPGHWGLRRNLFFWLQVLVALLVIAWWGIKVVEFVQTVGLTYGNTGAYFGLPRALQRFAHAGGLFMATAGVVAALVLIPLNLLVYSSPWRVPDRLADVYQTHMTPREITFGALYWGLIAGMLIPAACVVAGWLPWLTTWGYRFHPQHRVPALGEFEGLKVVAILILAFEGLLCIAALAVWSWLREARMRGATFVVLPVLCCGAGVVALSGHFLGISLLRDLLPTVPDDVRVFGCLLLVGTAMTWHFVGSGMAFAPSRFISSIDPLPFRMGSVLGGITARQEDNHHRANLAAFRRQVVPVFWRFSFGCFVLLLGAGSIAMLLLRPANVMAAALAVSLAALFGTTLSVLYREIRSIGRLALVRDALDLSLLRRLKPAHLLFLLLAFGISLVERYRATANTSGILTILYQVVFIAVPGVLLVLMAHSSLSAWILCPDRCRPVRVAVYGALPILLFLESLFVEPSMPDGTGGLFSPLGSSLVGTMVLLVFAIASVRGFRSLQRLHDATMQDVPVGGVGWLTFTSSRGVR